METQSIYITSVEEVTNPSQPLPSKSPLTLNRNTRPQTVSSSALDETLLVVRAVRDTCFSKNPSSRAGLLVSQFAHALMKIQRGMPATKDDVQSLIRAGSWSPLSGTSLPTNGKRERPAKKGRRHRRRPWRESNIRRPSQPRKHAPVLSGGSL